MYKLCKNYLIMMAVFLLLSTALSQCHDTQSTNFNQQLAEKLEAKLADIAKKYELIGISATVMFEDKSTWQSALGISSAECNDSLNCDFLFCFASNTKMFTAAAILKLVEQNKLSLDDSLHKWLPTYANIDSTITIR